MITLLIFGVFKLMFWMLVAMFELMIIPIRIVWFLLVGWWAGGTKRRCRNTARSFKKGFWDGVLFCSLFDCGK